MSVYQQPKGSIVNKIIIALLLGALIYVIYEPYQIRKQEDLYKRESRLRMLNIRTAQLQHISKFYRYNSSLDSLVQFVKDSILAQGLANETFKPLSHGTFAVESLLYSPKSHRPYTFSALDTTRIKKYYLECPDGYGSIGSLTEDAKINKASWEE
jgi:hypothetical protein